MGNSNTSGLQEEEISTTQVQESSVKEAGQADGKEVENHTASLAEVKDHSEKENGAATNVPNGAADPHVANQTSREREEKETEDQPPAESPTVEVKSNATEESHESSEMQPNSVSNDSREHDKLLGNTDGEGENNTVPVSEDKDYQEKEIDGFSSGVPKEAEDPHIVNQISDEREQETEVVPPAESPKFEVKTNNEAGSEVCDTQPTSPSKHSEHPEIQQESNLKENLLQISDHHLEKQTSIKKEEEGTETSTSEAVQLSHDPDPQEFGDSKFDQPELASIHVDPPTQDSNNSLHIHEDFLGSNLNCTSEKNGDAIGTNISKDMNEIVVSGSNLEVDIGKDDFTLKERTAEEVSCEDRLGIEDRDETGNDIGEKSVIKSDLLNGVGAKCNGEIPTKKSPISTISPKEESEVTCMDESQNPQTGVSEPTDDCIVLAAETALAETESEPVENKPSDCLIHSCDESVKESKIDSEKLSQSESLMIGTEGENNQEGVEDFICCGGNKDSIEEAKVAKNGGLVDEHSNDQNAASVEHSEDTQKEVEMVPDSGTVSTDSALVDCKREEASEEGQVFEEAEDKTKTSYGNENSKDARENGEQCIPPVEQEEVSLTKAPLSLFQPQDNQQNNEMQSENIQNGNDSIPELKPEINGEFLVTEGSPFDSKKSMAETLTPVAESAIEKPNQDISQHTAETMMAPAEANAQVNNVSDQNADAQESLGRLSTESNSNNSNTQAQIQKSPSFDLDLRIEARTEESDRTPLLYHDKTATEDFSGEQDVSLGSPIARAQDKLQCHAMPVEEKVVRMERSDSDKLKTPFLGFLKEEGEAPIIVTPQVHGNNAAAKRADKESSNLHAKEVTANSKEKRKPRSSLFTTCMCCTTVLN